MRELHPLGTHRRDEHRDEHRGVTPSLLSSLMSQHLDPGYAAAASKRGGDRVLGRADLVATVVGSLVVGCVLGVGMSALARVDSADSDRHAQVLASVRSAESRADLLSDERDLLARRVEDARTDTLRDDAAGAAVLADVDDLEMAAGAVKAVGPGVVVSVSEPPPRRNLSDVGDPVRGSSQSVVLDRDLQVVVNSLWASGAEAVTVNDVRMGPGVTVRQAGGAMLVDNRPVFSPYEVAAIGSPTQLQARFAVSDAYLRMSALSQLFEVGFDISVAAEVSMPGAVVRQVRSAVGGGER